MPKRDIQRKNKSIILYGLETIETRMIASILKRLEIYLITAAIIFAVLARDLYVIIRHAFGLPAFEGSPFQVR